MVLRDREDTSNRASDRLTALEREILTLFTSGSHTPRPPRRVATVRLPSGTPSTASKKNWRSRISRNSSYGPVRTGLLDDVVVGR